MEQKAFDLVVEKVGAALEEQGFAAKGQASSENGRVALYLSETIAYSVLYNSEKKRFELRTCGMTEEGPDEKWKSISMWLFDPETDSTAEAESIVNDFVDTIHGPKRVAALQATKKSRKNDDDTSDPVFFFNRIISILPELKEALNEERIQYGEIRAVTFAREKILPRVEAMLTQSGKEDQVEKLGTVLNDMYENGDMDVRSIISIVFFNGIDNEKAIENLKGSLNEETLKAYQAARKVKGKSVKPEKVKKQSKIVAEALKNNQGRR